jgi:hypothetical protein
MHVQPKHFKATLKFFTLLTLAFTEDRQQATEEHRPYNLNRLTETRQQDSLRKDCTKLTLNPLTGVA